MLVGVIGPDHIGVVEHADDLHFPEESGDGMLGGCTERQHDLEGHDAIHQLMPSLEYATHGTDAKSIEQQVTPENETFALPDQQAAGLKVRQCS